MRTARAAAALLVLAAPARAMFPPTSASQVGLTSVPRGLTSASGDGLGISLGVRYAERSRLRSGATDVANPGGERSRQLRTTLILDHRVYKRLSAVAVIPHLSNQAESGGARASASGMGDVSLIARLSVFKPQALTRKELFALAGVELPTGKTQARDASGARLPLSQQPGSDSFDLIAGAAGVWSFWSVSFYADAVYKRAGREAYTFGDAFSANAGFNRPLPFAPAVSVAAELNLELAGRDRSKFPGPKVGADGVVRDTGSRTLSVTPSLQWRPGKTAAFTAGVQVPVRQFVNGTQLKAALAPHAGLSARF